MKTEYDESNKKYELEMVDLKQDVDRLQNKYKGSKAARDKLQSEHELIKTRSTNLAKELSIIREQNEQLQRSDNALQEEITNLQYQSYIYTSIYMLYFTYFVLYN